MTTFSKLQEYLKDKKIGEKISHEDIATEIVDRDNSDGVNEYSVLKMYLYCLDHAGILEGMKTENSYIVQMKFSQDIKLIDFLEAVAGGNWKEWFIQVGE